MFGLGFGSVQVKFGFGLLSGQPCSDWVRFGSVRVTFGLGSIDLHLLNESKLKSYRNI